MRGIWRFQFSRGPDARHPTDGRSVLKAPRPSQKHRHRKREKRTLFGRSKVRLTWSCLLPQTNREAAIMYLANNHPTSKARCNFKVQNAHMFGSSIICSELRLCVDVCAETLSNYLLWEIVCIIWRINGTDARWPWNLIRRSGDTDFCWLVFPAQTQWHWIHLEQGFNCALCWHAPKTQPSVLLILKQLNIPV